LVVAEEAAAPSAFQERADSEAEAPATRAVVWADAQVAVVAALHGFSAHRQFSLSQGAEVAVKVTTLGTVAWPLEATVVAGSSRALAAPQLSGARSILRREVCLRAATEISARALLLTREVKPEDSAALAVCSKALAKWPVHQAEVAFSPVGTARETVVLLRPTAAGMAAMVCCESRSTDFEDPN
jgi:hypothetical protein